MSETEPAHNALPEDVQEPAQAAEGAEGAEGDKPETDWKAEARKWESRAKANSEAAQRLAEIEDAAKTNEERLQEQVQELSARNAALELGQLRATVATEKGLDGGAARFLAGETREELEESADALAALVGNQGPRSPEVQMAGIPPTSTPDADERAFAAALRNQLS